MAVSPTSLYAAPPAPSPTLLLTFLLLILFFSPISHASAANSGPAPPPPPRPTLHGVVAPGVAAAPPPADRNHYNVNQRAQQPSGPYTPLVTPAPSAVSDAQALKNQGFRQETFYTCMTAPSGREHCGWHTPVLKQAKQGSAAAAVAAPGRATDTRLVVAVVVGLAGVFAVGMM